MIRIVLIALIGVLAFISSQSIFIVNEKEQAIITQFGKPKRTITESGLQFRIPFIEKVQKFDKRVLQWDGAANEIPTNDDKYIFIDTFARWKISDPLKFYKAAKNERTAQSRIDDVIDGIVRDEISNRSMEEIIRTSSRKMETYNDDEKKQTTKESKDQFKGGARKDIIVTILNNVKSKFAELDMGIEVLDVQIKRINYNKQVQNKLFNRMISEQNMIAEKYRALGQGKKQEILGLQIQEEKTILSNAYKQSQIIKGKADAKAIKIYANAYEQDKILFEFLKSLDAYEQVIDPTTTIILSTDSEFFKHLK